MNHTKKHTLTAIFTIAVLTWLISCDSDKKLVQPDGNAQVTLNIVFAQSIAKSEGLADFISANSVVNEVTVSVIDAASRTAIIKEQRLSIQNGFAEGELSIPMGGQGQAFIFVVFASDFQTLRFYAGLSEPVPLQPGENDPVEIQVLPAISIAGFGDVDASSTFGSGSEPTKAIDLNFGTSWFSAGSADPNGNSSIFTWTAPQDIFIATLGIFNNSFHADENLQQGFGFETVEFQVLDATGNQLFEETFAYPRGILPVARVSPLVNGRSIQLLLNNHEDVSRSGFSELLIVGFDLSGNPIKILVSIDVTSTTPLIDVGQTAQFQATGRYSDASTRDITNQVAWASNDQNVATINSAGLATGVGPGTATISATKGAISSEATLTVNALQLRSIAISPQNPTIDIGKTQQFTAMGTFSDNSTSDITNQVAWASSDQNVATINSTGLATALAAGTTTISATQGNISNQTPLTVNAVQLSPPTISNMQTTLISLNDSTSCSNGGSLIEISFDYTDPDGDVTDNSGGTVINNSFTFQPGGSTGGGTVTSFTQNGNGFSGSISFLRCTVFGSSTSIERTISLTDAGGLTSNSLTTTFQKPQGANSPPGGQRFRTGETIPGVAVPK